MVGFRWRTFKCKKRHPNGQSHAIARIIKKIRVVIGIHDRKIMEKSVHLELERAAVVLSIAVYCHQPGDKWRCNWSKFGQFLLEFDRSWLG